MQTIPMTMNALMMTVQSHVPAKNTAEKWLAYPVMAEVPPAFNRMAHMDYVLLSEADPELDWDDYCPAYALGLLTYDAYHGASWAGAKTELETQWDALRGTSKLGWAQARAIIARSWNAVTRLQYEARA